MNKTYTIALLSQPNAGKSTLFNGLTGSRQHVGNWPGKTVEKKEGRFTVGGNSYAVVDLPGSYSLSANSDEEIVTRDYIASGKADMICILIDASQLERSMFMLADYIGINVPTVLLLNMMDVAKQQGQQIDCEALERELNIPVLPFIAADKKKYQSFYELLNRTDKENWILNEDLLKTYYETKIGTPFLSILNLMPENGIGIHSAAWLACKLIENDALVSELIKDSLSDEEYEQLQTTLSEIKDGNVQTGNCKFAWVDYVLKGKTKSTKPRNKIKGFDKLATSKSFGKPLALIVIIVGLILSIVIAKPLMILSALVMQLSGPISGMMTALGFPNFLISLVCDGVLGAVYFSLMMVCFIFGISLVFGFIEEIGYMARISFVFDDIMRKMGLHGKAVMPFLVSFGCNIGGATGTRVLDTWGQRMLTIALSWVVPCASTWAVVGLVSSLFFGSSAALVVVSLFAVALLHIFITYKIFGKSLLKETDKVGLIMELPPYHKPRWGALFRYVWSRMGDVLQRALKIIVLVSVVFWALSYSSDGMIENSLIYKIGMAIEPVTMFFGLRWQLFMSWLASGLGKESSLGVLSALFQSEGIWGAIISQKSAVIDTVGVGNTMLSIISKPEALAFIYAFFFNMPCLMALSAASQETHSLKWTIRVALYYIGMSLVLAGIVYHIGLLIF